MSEIAPKSVECDAVESVLESTGLEWTRRASAWALPANRVVPREILLTCEADGIRLEAVLAQWEEIDASCARALDHFLHQAESGFHFVRLKRSAERATGFALVPEAHLEEDLPVALVGMSAACQHLPCEVEALLQPEIARQFLTFHTADHGSQ